MAKYDPFSTESCFSYICIDIQRQRFHPRPANNEGLKNTRLKIGHDYILPAFITWTSYCTRTKIPK